MKVKKKESKTGTSGPSSQLLALMVSFFAEHGLESTNKAFTKELKQMRQTAGWAAPDGVEDGVNLQMVIDNWTKNGAAPTSRRRAQNNVDVDSQDETTTSGPESSSARNTSSSSSGSGSASSDDDTSSDSSSESESEVAAGKTHFQV